MEFRVPGADPAAVTAARERAAGLLVPREALGRLADLGVWVAGRQRHCPPAGFARKRVIVLAGDAPAGQPAQSRDGSPTGTLSALSALAAGTAPVSVLAALASAPVRVVDVGVDGDPDVERRREPRSCGSIDREDAMTAEEAERAVATGAALADEEADSGTDLLVAGAVGHGLTTHSAALVAALLDQEPVAVASRGATVADAEWMLQVTVVRDAIRRARLAGGGLWSTLAVVGGPTLAALAGLLAQAAVRRTPVILDGSAACAAACAAARLAPGAETWWLAGTRSPEPAQEIALRTLGLAPLLDAGINLEDGSGAVLALGVLDAAVAALSGIADRSGFADRADAAPPGLRRADRL